MPDQKHDQKHAKARVIRPYPLLGKVLTDLGPCVEHVGLKRYKPFVRKKARTETSKNGYLNCRSSEGSVHCSHPIIDHTGREEAILGY